MSLEAKEARRRRSSSLVYKEPPESLEQLSDQSALPNLNAEWVNAKGEFCYLGSVTYSCFRRANNPGAWAIHAVLIFLGKIFFDIIPGMSQETSWTLVNLSYVAGSYLMFHYVRGVPFDFNSGAFDNLNMWEQIDNGDQYTPAKKFLLTVPIVLFLASTHYTHYDLTYFVINCLATLAVVIPKLPSVGPTPYSAHFRTNSTSFTGYGFPFSTRRPTTRSRRAFHICIFRNGCNNACISSTQPRSGSISLGCIAAGVALGRYLCTRAGSSCVIVTKVACRIQCHLF
jgi:hypothetical protein